MNVKCIANESHHNCKRKICFCKRHTQPDETKNKTKQQNRFKLKKKKKEKTLFPWNKNICDTDRRMVAWMLSDGALASCFGYRNSTVYQSGINRWKFSFIKRRCNVLARCRLQYVLNLKRITVEWDVFRS